MRETAVRRGIRDLNGRLRQDLTVPCAKPQPSVAWTPRTVATLPQPIISEDARMKLDTPTSGSELTAEAVAVLEAGHKPIPPTFLRDLFGRVPPEDLASLAPDPRGSGSGSLRAPQGAPDPGRRRYPPHRSRDRARGRRRDVTVLEIVNDNMPFLLDSTARRDRRRGLRAAARGPSDPRRGAGCGWRPRAPRGRGHGRVAARCEAGELHPHPPARASTIRKPAPA